VRTAILIGTASIIALLDPSWGIAAAAAAMGQGDRGSAPASEYEVKAAFLYNFARFVEWPAAEFLTPGSPVDVCVLGEDPFGPALEKTVSNKRAKGHPFVVSRVDSLDAVRHCQILFISSKERTPLSRIQERLSGAPVLTVCEREGFAALGCVINFIVKGANVRLEINPAAAERAGLTISSNLLSVATVIGESGEVER